MNPTLDENLPLIQSDSDARDTSLRSPLAARGLPDQIIIPQIIATIIHVGSALYRTAFSNNDEGPNLLMSLV
ncbi:unnamed protein product [Boreogadus saida]